MTVKESNELFVDITRRKNTLKKVSEELNELEEKVNMLNNVLGIVQDSICANCTHFKDKDHCDFREKDYCRYCYRNGEVTNFEDKRRKNEKAR
jgi:hypothetical protein